MSLLMLVWFVDNFRNMVYKEEDKKKKRELEFACNYIYWIKNGGSESFSFMRLNFVMTSPDGHLYVKICFGQTLQPT